MPAVDSDKAFNHVKAKWKNGCPICGVKAWEVSGSVHGMPELTNDGNVNILQQFVAVPVTCKSCGFVALLGAMAAGAITP